MTQAELQRLAAGCRLSRLARGDNVFRVGEPCEEFHVTVMGQIKLFAVSPAGQEKVIELVGPGNSFAEALMFTGKHYIINAQALTDSAAADGEQARGARRDRTRFAFRDAHAGRHFAPAAWPGA
jgi:CRP-like cAMP-binding protein